jgi:EAL and modified HD-GYP domain-containing signal transduction protein
MLPAASFPLVEICPVANVHNEWVALSLRAAGQPTDAGFIGTLFGPDAHDLLAAIAPLDCILRLGHPGVLTPNLLALLPPNRVVLAVEAAALAGENVARRLTEVQLEGYRVILDGALPEGVKAPAALGTRARDCAGDAPRAGALPLLFGPHWAHGIPTRERFDACAAAGFAWFSGDHVCDMAPEQGDDGTSRKRLLAMLALLARDADSSELEAQLKQDAALSYHLLKLVNSAAFSTGATITSFNQAISRLGRRQLQRWLQLLLYARQRPDDPPNPLLPLAALRGAALEALCQADGGDRDAQDQAFMAGVFSLLDRLFRMPMADLVGELPLPEVVEQALVARTGRLGRRLLLAEAPVPTPALVDGAGTDPATWWQAQLHACHWAIQVARNV